MKRWPPYAGPGWIAWYALCATSWCVVVEAWAYLGCLIVISVGVLLSAAAARALGAGEGTRRDPP